MTFQDVNSVRLRIAALRESLAQDLGRTKESATVADLAKAFTEVVAMIDALAAEVECLQGQS